MTSESVSSLVDPKLNMGDTAKEDPIKKISQTIFEQAVNRQLDKLLIVANLAGKSSKTIHKNLMFVTLSLQLR